MKINFLISVDFVEPFLPEIFVLVIEKAFFQQRRNAAWLVQTEEEPSN